MYGPHCVLCYRRGVFLFLHLHLYISFAKFPIWNMLTKSSIWIPSPYMSLPYSCLMCQYKTGWLSSFASSLLRCLWISLYLVSIIWQILFQLPSPFNQMYPSPILYNSSLKFVAQPSHFAFPACHSQQDYNNLSCSINKILYQYFAVLQSILPYLVSVPISHSAAPFAVPHCILQPSYGILPAFHQ